MHKTPNLLEQWNAMKPYVDPQWNTFAPFVKWARLQGFNGHQNVVRIDENLPHGPENCRLIAGDGKPLPIITARAPDYVDVQNERAGKSIVEETKGKTTVSEEEPAAPSEPAPPPAAKTPEQFRAELDAENKGLKPKDQRVAIAGELLPVAGWCDKLGLSKNSVYAKIRHGAHPAAVIAEGWAAKKREGMKSVGVESPDEGVKHKPYVPKMPQQKSAGGE